MTEYKIAATDNSSTGYSGTLPAEYTRVYMIVDTDADFTAGATEYEMTLSGTEWILSGTVDLDDGQFFSFATHIPPAPG